MGVAFDVIAIAELRAKLADVLERLDARERPLYVTQRGQARAVLLPVKKYEALLEQIEYLDDSLEAMLARERRSKGLEKTRSLDEVMKDLRRRGRLSRSA